MSSLRLGLVGFGVVGEGIYQVLSRPPKLDCEVRKICIKDATKPRNAPLNLFTTDISLLLEDPKINVIVELTDDPEFALELTLQALKKGKHVMSANKKRIANNLEALLKNQNATYLQKSIQYC